MINEISNSVGNFRSEGNNNLHESNEEGTKFQDNIFQVKNTNNSMLHKIFNCKKLTCSNKINYQEVGDGQVIDAKGYVYCGGVNGFPKNNIGISLNELGELILIKGKSYDLIKGLLKKYKSKYLIHMAKITDFNCSIKFSHLYVNANGMLIGDEKNSGKSYSINVVNISTEGDINEQHIKIFFVEYKKNDDDGLKFKLDDENFISFRFKEKSLMLETLQCADKKSDYTTTDYTIELPLKRGYCIKSVKRMINVLQIETLKGNKTRIFYLNPKHISLPNLHARHLSHKPPQNFSSYFGSDPHEKYHAGQPFSSDRKGNFSSKHIPLFSSTVDNFRFHLKSGKDNIYQGNKKRAAIDFAKGMDLGIGGVITTSSGIAKNIKLRQSCQDVKDKGAMLNYMQARTNSVSEVLTDTLGKRGKLDVGDALIEITKNIKIQDEISLQNIDRISGFFGIAAGGIPFSPGWFAGVLGEFSNTHHLLLSKTKDEHLSMAFTNKSKIGITGLTGTGQGLEKAFLKTSGADYMTMLPAEANIILTVQCADSDNFSFSLPPEIFAQQFNVENKDSELNEFIANNAELKNLKEKELAVTLEAKSEFRLQYGRMINENTYMVMPRTALGARVAIKLLKFNSTKESIVNKNGNLIQNSNIGIDGLVPEFDIFREAKIMPIPMAKGAELWCFPLPLTEESLALKSNTPISGIKIFNKKSDNNTSPFHDDTGECKITDIKDNYRTNCHFSDFEKIPLIMTEKKDGSMNKLYKLGRVGAQCNTMNKFIIEMNEIKRSILSQKRMSLNKNCMANIISHYEDITSLTEEKTYRLKKIEIRRIGSFHHVNATMPLSIINFSSKNEVLYNEFLGEIDFLYKNATDAELTEFKKRLKFLY
ncbi:hypothetical protein [Pectobacterium versatile]|uniref:hypothetical protein n=1 Tax=Pectobacterium versatile TaxID=2488639 RepID=UPI001CC9C2D7|nr:hypothetical protein [Pectobacterium versatile]